MWRRPTVEDIAATLSRTELDAYRASAGDDGADPVESLIDRTAEMVRSYCRANQSCRISPHAGEIPESLISPAMDYAAYDVLKRLPVEVGEDRRLARRDAVELFERVASGKTRPEAWPDGDADKPETVLPAVGEIRRYRL